MPELTVAESGRGAFGPELEALLGGDPHRPGSVDAMLLDRQVRVTTQNQSALYARPASVLDYRRGSRPELEAFVGAVTEGALHEVQIAVALARFCARIPRDFPLPDRSTASGFYGDFSAFLCGGTEEEVIKKGSPLAAERARVLCLMAQIAGLPARMVFLARDEPVERHTVVEIFLGNRWCVLDAFSGRFYAWPKHGYASAWDVRTLPQLVDNSPDRGRVRYVDAAYFRHVAIATYDLSGTASYSYPWDPIPADLAVRLSAGLGA